jgi:hypothetical protein
MADHLSPACHARDDADEPATLPIQPEPIDAIRIVVEPSDEPTVIYFRRYKTPDQAALVAKSDPDAMAREARDGFGLFVRTEGGIRHAGACAGAG